MFWLCWLCDCKILLLTSYIDVNINIKQCFVPIRGSEEKLVMTQIGLMS